MTNRPSPAMRDAALRRSLRVRTTVLVGSVGLAGVLALFAARSQPGVASPKPAESAPPLPALTPPPSTADDAQPVPTPPPAPPVSTPLPPQTSSGGS